MILASPNKKPVTVNSILSEPSLKYKQIAQAIIADIELGKLQVNDKLLSITKCSALNAVSRDTVEHAYNELRSQGYIKAVKSKGFFVTGKKRPTAKVIVLSAKNKRNKKAVYTSVLETLHERFDVEIDASNKHSQAISDIIANNTSNDCCFIIVP